MENYSPAEDENQGVVSTMARNNPDTGEELEPDISPAGNLPSPDPDPEQTTLYDDKEESGVSSED